MHDTILGDIADISRAMHEHQARADATRATLRAYLRTANEMGYSLGELAAVTGLTREGIRYLLGRQKKNG